MTRTSGTLYLLCGKMAAGKSTLARSLRQNSGAVLLAEDELLERLYPGEIAGLSDYVRCSKRLKEALSGHICSLLQSGLSIVLDFPANTKSQRVWMRELIDKSEAEHELHVLEASDSECLERLAKRRLEAPERHRTDTEEMFHAVSAHYCAPGPEEAFHVVIHRSGSSP